MTAPDNDRIADPLDRAVAETSTMVAAALSFRKPIGPTANGRCHQCDIAVADSHRWCGPSCRDDWERDQRRERV